MMNEVLKQNSDFFFLYYRFQIRTILCYTHCCLICFLNVLGNLLLLNSQQSLQMYFFVLERGKVLLQLLEVIARKSRHLQFPAVLMFS